jgi:predicted GNAT family N-acyltransferase
MAYSIEVARFEDETDAIRSVRETVFVNEQAVPIELEWDGLDPACTHVLARATDGTPVGTGRLTPDDHIGRMAVLREWRGHGVGSAMLQALLDIARRQGRRRIVLNSQTAAMPFYARFGFVASGPEFMEAGIPHREMALDL